MSPRSRGAKGIASAIASASSNHGICRSCRQALSRRAYASSAAAQATVEAPSVNQGTSISPETSPVPQPKFAIKAGVVLSRPPLITPDPHPFETAYYLYQRRLNERLALPFTQYFYYKKGSPAYEKWRTKRHERGGAAARDIGKYNAYGDEGWNDEALLGDESGSPQRIVEQLIDEEGRATEFIGESGDLKKAGLKRTTEADAKNDQRSLERSLSRTLYLLVKSKKESPEDESFLWRFPSGGLEGKEGLKEAAQRILGNSCGVNMHTWFVGNHPVGHYISTRSVERDAPSNGDAQSDQPVSIASEKTFFMKARIMAGQAEVKAGNELEDFKWLAKEEIQRLVHPDYWARIKNMLVVQ